MTLITSISGIRGTIGGKTKSNLTPIDITLFVSAYAEMIKENSEKCLIVVGRDARISGQMVKNIVIATLNAYGCDVVDIDLATTPTTEMAVIKHRADGGIIITASHNPKEWNALKLLNDKGEFISGEEGEKLLELVKKQDFNYAKVDSLGKTVLDRDALKYHIEKILELPYVNKEAIAKANIKVMVDAINSVGAVAIPPLLEALGVKNYEIINDDISGNFAHNPEPLKRNLTETINKAKGYGADVTFVVDPDVDRLAIIDENGEMIGEEYTLVSVADYVLSKKVGNTVSNLSSSMALGNIASNFGSMWYQSAVGEVNVVAKMREVEAVIGGEGNGGVILPDLHYGRDSLVGIALFLSYMAESGKSVSEIRSQYPDYFMSKKKISFADMSVINSVFKFVAEQFVDNEKNWEDGLKIYLQNEWIHLRKSNTEPIMRIYTESNTQQRADELADMIITMVEKMLKDM